MRIRRYRGCRENISSTAGSALQMTPPAFAGMSCNRRPQCASRALTCWKSTIDAAARNALDAWLARRGLSKRELILLQTGNKRTMRGWLPSRATNTKYWPVERWAEVIRALRGARPDAAILLMGVPREFALNAQIIRTAAVPGLHNVADDLPIRILLPLVRTPLMQSPSSCRHGTCVNAACRTQPSDGQGFLGHPILSCIGRGESRRPPSRSSARLMDVPTFWASKPPAVFIAVRRELDRQHPALDAQAIVHYRGSLLQGHCAIRRWVATSRRVTIK